MKGQSVTHMTRDEEDCKREAEIDAKKNPEKYHDMTSKIDYSFWPSKHFQACMIARGYKTLVRVEYIRQGLQIFEFDVNAKAEKTEETVWKDLRRCHKFIQETKLTGGEKAGIAVLFRV